MFRLPHILPLSGPRYVYWAGGSPEHLSRPSEKMKPAAHPESRLQKIANNFEKQLSVTPNNLVAAEAQAFETIMRTVVDDFFGGVSAVGAVVGPAGAGAYQQEVDLLIKQLSAALDAKIRSAESNPVMQRHLIQIKNKLLARRVTSRPLPPINEQ